MLQQTTVPHATPYFLDFTAPLADGRRPGRAPRTARSWPPGRGSATTPAPATCWPAPGRWRSDHGGVFPDTEEGLRALPGVGAYTAAAVAAIAFDRAGQRGRRQCRAGDGAAVRRRDAAAGRQAGAEARWPAALVARRPARRLGPGADGPGRHDLPAQGAALRPLPGRRPTAPPAPRGAPGDLSRARRAKAERPRRYGVAYVLDATATRSPWCAGRRKGLLGGMLGLPTSDWRATPGPTPRRWPPRRSTPTGATSGEVEHVFTHFALTLRVLAGARARRRGAMLDAIARGLRRPCRACS